MADNNDQPEIEQPMDVDAAPNISHEVKQAARGHAIDISGVNMPLDMTVRSVALTLAVRLIDTRTVKEGNLYQQLKMDNKLSGPVSFNDVIHAALVFEHYLWGEWSKGIAGHAMEQTMEEVEKAINADADKQEDPPTRPAAGE